jgi:hypothetical protein
VRRSDVKWPLGRRENRKTEPGGMVQDRDQRRALVNTVMNIRVQQNVQKMFSN